MESELNRTITSGSRQARVTDSHGKNSVVMHTYYLGRWYYDGHYTFKALDIAVKFRDEWLAGKSVNDSVLAATDASGG